jgi:hypothetical protein
MLNVFNFIKGQLPLRLADFCMTLTRGQNAMIVTALVMGHSQCPAIGKHL